MTSWLPEIPAGNDPIYIRLANQIAEDIALGNLPVGEKLPPQRNLAFDLGITVGTVGRAYSLVRERGLVSGEVGRGTYVLGSPPATQLEEEHREYLEVPSLDGSPATRPGYPALVQTRAMPTNFGIDHYFGGTRHPLPPPGTCRLDSTSTPQVGQSEIIAPLMLQILSDSSVEMASYTRTIPDSWRRAGRTWLSRGGWSPAEEVIIPTFGAAAAIMSVISATTSPGDRIAFEELTYNSISRSAALAGRQAIHIPRDEEGPIPDEMAKVCAQRHPKLLFLMPTMHNPTTTLMSEDRRRQVVAIARQYNVWLIEDEVYGSLRSTSLEPIASMAPERTFHVGSLSKSVAAGIRGGWVACPPTYAQRVFTAHKMLTGGLSFMLSELSARLVLSGAASEIRDLALKEIATRHQIARQCFGNMEMNADKDTPFIWLKVPEPWLSGTFKAAAASANILIDDEDEFKAGRASTVYHRIRLGTTNPQTRQEYADALKTLQALLTDSTGCYDSFE